LRLSRANGVYAPTPITDETEAFGLTHLERMTAQAEHALGWALDVAHTDGALELGGSAYRTTVTHPLIVRIPPGSAQGYQLVNSDEPLLTQGVDVYARYRMEPFHFTVSYAYIDATRPEIAGIFGDNFEVDTTLRRPVPYDPKHTVNLDWAYERERDRVLGVAVHFVGRQVLADSSFGVSQPYVTVDARFEKQIRRVTVFAYGKDLTGVYQLQYASVLRKSSGAAGQWADNAWGPLDGRVINLGLRVEY
jgi:iron complex outermembrane receptor protein